MSNPALAGGGAILDINYDHWTFTAGDFWVIVRSAATAHRTAVDMPLGAVSYEWSVAGLSLSDRDGAENPIGIQVIPGATGTGW